MQALSNKHTFTAQTGYYRNRILSGYGLGQLYYDYQLVADGNECSSNPCLNGGRCIDGCASYTCLCPTGYVGTNCQLSNQCTLNVTARHGRGLSIGDRFYGTSDPYLRFTGIYRIGTQNYYLRRSTNYRLKTRTLPGTRQSVSDHIIGHDFKLQCMIKICMEEMMLYRDCVAFLYTKVCIILEFISLGYSGYVEFDYSCL